MCYLRPSLRNGFGSIAHEVLEVGAAVVGMNKLKDILPTEGVFITWTKQQSRGKTFLSHLSLHTQRQDTGAMSALGRITMKGFGKFQLL